MRPKTLILFAVAIGCGLIASIGVSQYIDKAKLSGGPMETSKIFVASTEISAGERLEAKNVSLEEWPRDRIPEGAISDLKKLEEKFALGRTFKGQPILESMISDSKQGNYDQTIPPGYRVVAVKVDEYSSAGGLIRPGDRVDLMVFLRKNADIPETGTHTILRDVNVFAVQGETERQVDKQGTSRDLRTVSLLVTPKQAEGVMLAKELGVLSLTLRRPGDTVEEVGEGETVSGLLGRNGENANEHQKKDQESKEIVRWVNENPPPTPTPAPAQPEVAVAPPAPKFIMTIRSSNGDKRYSFVDLDSPPQEIEDQTNTTSTPAIPAAGSNGPRMFPSATRVEPPAPQTQPGPLPVDVDTTEPTGGADSTANRGT